MRVACSAASAPRRSPRFAGDRSPHGEQLAVLCGSDRPMRAVHGQAPDQR